MKKKAKRSGKILSKIDGFGGNVRAKTEHRLKQKSVHYFHEYFRITAMEISVPLSYSGRRGPQLIKIHTNLCQLKNLRTANC